MLRDISSTKLLPIHFSHESRFFVFATFLIEKQKKKFAAESLEYNSKNPAFRKLFPELKELQEKRKKDSTKLVRSILYESYTLTTRWYANLP